MAGTADNALLKQLPQVDELLKHEGLQRAIALVGRDVAADAVRDSIDCVRTAILAGADALPDIDAIAHAAAEQALALTQPSLRRVVNASGVIVHTNLGRSALAEEAIDAVNQIING